MKQKKLQQEEKTELKMTSKKRRRKSNEKVENFSSFSTSNTHVPIFFGSKRLCTKDETPKISKNSKMKLSNFPNLNNTQLEELGNENPTVKYLDMSKSFNLNTQSFSIIHEKWGKNLVSINLEYSNVTDDNLYVLLGGSQSLPPGGAQPLPPAGTQSQSLPPGGTQSLAPCGLPLRKVNLSNTPITDRGIHYLVKNCRNLKRITVNSTNITNLSLSLIAQFCPHVIHLDIAECWRVTDFGVQIVAQQFSVHLKVLDVSFCKLVTDAIFGYLCFYCPNLKVLRVKGTQVTPEGLLRLLPRVVLSELNVQGLPLVDLHLHQMISQKSLRILDASFCHGITSVGISVVLRGCLELEQVHLFGLNFSDCDLDFLRSFPPRIFC